MTSTGTTQSAVMRPAVGGVVKAANPAAFIYVLRDDSTYVARELRARLGLGDQPRAVQTLIMAEYAEFLDGLCSAFARAAEPRGPLELHVYSSADIEAARDQFLLPGHRVVSLDPLCESKGAIHLGLSRWYKPGGWELAGEGFRPGFAGIDDQIEHLRSVLKNSPVALVEDDVYTGETLAATAERLRSSGLDIRQLIVGIRIRQHDLELDDVPAAVAVRYELDAERPLAEQIDLGDPRDYLIGLSGLVILMGESSGRPMLGRAPYVLPFVQPSERASFPAESDWELSRSILGLARDFYSRLSSRLGRQVLLGHSDPEFVAFARHYLKARPEQEMADFVGEVLVDAELIAEKFFDGARLAARA